MLYEAGEQGVIPRTLCPVLMRDYLGPSLDTTIFATSNLILLFGRNPDQWDIVRDDPSLILNAINECVRLEVSDPELHAPFTCRSCMWMGRGFRRVGARS